MSVTSGVFRQVKIDASLKNAGRNLTDGASVLFEHALTDGTQVDYVLYDRQVRLNATPEANDKHRAGLRAGHGQPNDDRWKRHDS